MKIIKYKILSREVNIGTYDNPVIKQVFFQKTFPYSVVNEEIAKQESYNGEYTIEDGVVVIEDDFI